MRFAASAPTLFTRVLRPFSTTPTLAFAAESPSRRMSSAPQKATLAAGCFWGVEQLFRREFGQGKGLVDSKVGYCGGSTASPSYRAVCTGTTGHAEALQVTFDPSTVTYPQLLEFFFRMHDPTTLNRQGADTGPQYRSAVFTHGDEQHATASEVAEKVGKQWYKDAPVTTQILPAGQWWDAEDYHQLYLGKNPGGYECPAHFVRKFPPLE